MATLRLVVSLSLMAACYQRDPDFYATMLEPTEVEGPPGGEIDPEWQAGYADDNAAGFVDGSSDPADVANVTASCTDGEIDATLDGYGEWVELEGYGRVWRPYTTVVGVDFTPYETCGSWVWTDHGWTFACEWDWGWLPFHYGRWGWFDDYWAWQPGYEWTPAAVDWRGGGGYVGWRPKAPIIRDHRGSNQVVVRDHRGANDGSIVRDHRGANDGPIVRDHRNGAIVRDHRQATTKNWQWRFAATEDFGKPRIRAHLFKSPAEGLRVTANVSRAPVQAAVQPVRAASVMRARFAAATRLGARDHRYGAARVPAARVEAVRPSSTGPGSWRSEGPMRRSSTRAVDAAAPVYQPTYRARPAQARDGAGSAASEPAYVPPREAVVPPSHSPSRGFDRPAPAPQPFTPSRPSRGFDRPAPGRSSYSPSSPPPSYSSPRGSSSYAPSSSGTNNSRSNSSSSSSSSSRSYSSPARSSSSYSSPARSSSSHASPARSSGPASTGGGRSSGSRSHRR